MIKGQPYMDETVVREGGELVRKGGDTWVLCQIHNERTPSFKIYADRQRGHCFGCGWHGDSIDYVRALHGLTFKDALAYLGIKTGPLTSAERQAEAKARRERERKAELVKAFRTWELRTAHEIARTLRAFHHLLAMRTTYSEVQLAVLAVIQGEVDLLEYHYSILCGRNDLEKLALYKEMNDGG